MFMLPLWYRTIVIIHAEKGFLTGKHLLPVQEALFVREYHVEGMVPHGGTMPRGYVDVYSWVCKYLLVRV